MIEHERRLSELLPGVYPAFYPEEWRDDWAAFRHPGPPQAEVVVTRRGTLAQKRPRLAWERLAADRELLAEYRTPKESPVDYEARKRRFFERVVGLL